MSDDTSDLGDAEVVRETDKAILVRLESGEEKWVPKSVIDDDSEVYSQKNGTGTLIVKAWWAKKEKLA